MTSSKISKKGGRSDASASNSIATAGTEPSKKSKRPAEASHNANEVPDGQVMDLVYSFLNDFGYYKATHGIRIETQKRETAGGHTKPASWMGKSKELPTLQQIFEEWHEGKKLPKSGKRAAAGAQVDGGAENVPLPESEEDSDESSEQSTSSGEESDDESSSASENDSDSDSDSDEEMKEADDTTIGAKKAKTSKSASAVVLPSAKGKVEASPGKSQKRKRSPSTSSSEASSESNGDDSSDSSSSDESDDAPATKKAKVAADSDDTSSEDESDESSVEAAGVPLPESSDESSSDSDEETSSEEESESDDDSAPAKSAKAGSLKLAEKKTIAAKDDSSAPEDSSDSSSASESDDDSSSSDSDAASESQSPITQPTTNDASSADDNKGSESSETLAHPSPDFQPVPTPADDHVHPSRKHKIDDEPEDVPGAQKIRKKSNVPFSRIKDDTVVDQRFASNAFVPYDYAQKAHEKLIITKGKGFTKEKNKGKRGSYRGGLIDISGTKGIKFED